MALIDVLDEKGNPTGEKLNKNEIHLGGHWHQAAHVWIYNSRGEMLLQLRAKDKDSHPGQLDIAAAGHVDAGETALQTAIRETKEEINLDVTEGDLKEVEVRKVSKYNPDNNWQNNEIDHIYLLRYDGNIDDLDFPDREVEALEWISLEKLEEELKNPVTIKKYVPHGEYWGLVIDAIRKELE